MDELPAGAAGPALPAVGGDTVALTLEAAELLDVDVDELARLRALVAANRLGRLERRETVEAKPLEDTADGGGRDPGLNRDLLAGPASAAQGFDLRDDGGRRRPMQPVRPRGAIPEPLKALGREARQPFTHGPRADACGSCGGLRRLPAQHLLHNALSTKRRQPGILMDVHPVLRGITEASQLQLPRPGPGEHPIESSQLGHAARPWRRPRPSCRSSEATCAAGPRGQGQVRATALEAGGLLARITAEAARPGIKAPRVGRASGPPTRWPMPYPTLPSLARSPAARERSRPALPSEGDHEDHRE